DAADDPGLFARLLQHVHGALGLVGTDADDHAYTAVEYPVHLGFVNVALFLQPVEYSRTLPAGQVDAGAGAFGQHARNVFQQATADDVGHGLDGTGLADQLQQRLDVDAGRCHQQVGQRLAVELDVLDVGPGHLDDLADQRITVGVGAGGGQGQQHVAGLYLAAIDDLGFLHYADAEAGQVIVVAFIHAGHLGGFTTDQRTAGQLAACADAGDHLGGDVDIQLARGVVIKEKQRLGAADHQVVDAHGHEVDADLVVLVQIHRQSQLGADAVGSGHQHRLTVTRRNLAQGAEAAQTAHDFRARSALGDVLDTIYKRVARIDIDTGVLVTDGGLGGRLATHAWVSNDQEEEAMGRRIGIAI